MAKTPENRYIDKVHRQIDPDIWKIRMQMGMGAPRGIPDMLYRGDISDLWIEYKYVEDWTKKRTIPWNKLSEHQTDWLTNGHELNGPNEHAVVFGDESGKGVFIDVSCLTNKAIRDKLKPSDLPLLTPKEMAAKIKSVVLL